MFDPNAQQKASQAVVKKMAGMTSRTSNQAFISGSIRLGKEAGMSKHEICKNIERKLGPKEAAKVYGRL